MADMKNNPELAAALEAILAEEAARRAREKQAQAHEPLPARPDGPEPAPAPEPEPEPAPEPAPETEPEAPAPAPAPKRRTRRKKHPANVLNLFPLYLFVFLTVVFFLLNLLTPDRELSESENRMLQQRPRFTLSAVADGSYFSDLEAWYADQFFNRDGWISRSLAGLRLLGRHESNGVWLGRDGYLLAEPEPFNEALLSDKVSAMRVFQQSHKEINMQLAIAPSAATVLVDKLPKNAPVSDQPAVLSAISSALDGYVGTVDLHAALAPHAQEYIYYKTDHHWTSLGAYYAFSDMLSPLGIASPCSYDSYVVATDFEGTLSSESGSHASRDTVEIYVPSNTDVLFYVNYLDTGTKTRSMYVSAALEEKDKYTVFFGGNHPLVEIATTQNNDRVLLVFKDSYANCFMQFLTPYYERILMVDPRYYYDDLSLLISSENVTDVLFLYSADTFMTDTSLTDVLRSAS